MLIINVFHYKRIKRRIQEKIVKMKRHYRYCNDIIIKGGGRGMILKRERVQNCQKVCNVIYPLL